MLIVSSGHPDIKLVRSKMRPSTAAYVCAQFVRESAAFYFEPCPGDEAEVVVAEEHIQRVIQLRSHCE